MPTVGKLPNKSSIAERWKAMKNRRKRFPDLAEPTQKQVDQLFQAAIEQMVKGVAELDVSLPSYRELMEMSDREFNKVLDQAARMTSREFQESIEKAGRSINQFRIPADWTPNQMKINPVPTATANGEPVEVIPKGGNRFDIMIPAKAGETVWLQITMTTDK